jgi:hypothetical protein
MLRSKSHHALKDFCFRADDGQVASPPIAASRAFQWKRLKTRQTSTFTREEITGKQPKCLMTLLSVPASQPLQFILLPIVSCG